ncbi:hypothetical protein [Aeromicrobium sp. UC242_57]|uniref:hypothetical protein n=1 Tax=Aeromicrobium sp. UC242_57 TaxID=3374624 RepID=UPI0037B1340A
MSTAPHSTADVVVCDAFLRDGIQGWPDVLPTADKVAVLNALVASGVSELDVTSFVPAKLVPQFADSLDLLAAVPPDVAIRVLTVNARGVQGVVEAHRTVRNINRCGIPYSVSEPHNLANLRRNHHDHRIVVAEMVDRLVEEGIDPLIGVATAYGCPIQGRVPREDVLDTVEWVHGLGVRTIMFGDTTGTADPATVSDLFSTAASTWPDAHFIAHFHDNRGLGIANVLAAIAAGAQTVDASLGGVGGEPSMVDQGDVGESGNVTTEDLVAGLEQMGISTGIDREALLEAGLVAESVLGRRLHSRVLRAGLIPFTAERREV